MGLKSEDFEILNNLIITGRTIEKSYKVFLNGYMPKTMCNSIKELIKEEDKLIKKLNLTREKFAKIKRYFIKEHNVYLKENLPVLSIGHITSDNYAYYRILKKCIYRLMNVESCYITVNSVRKEFADLETGLVFNSIMRASSAMSDKNIAASLKQKAYFALLDSPSIESQILETSLEPIPHVTNTIKTVINFIVDKQANLISQMFGGEVVFESGSVIDAFDSENEEIKEKIEKKYANKKGIILLVDSDTYDIRYDEVIGDRFDELFERTYKALDRQIRINPNYMSDPMFHIILSYLKVIATILPEPRRKKMYETIKENMSNDGIFEKYESLYDDAINDIEDNMIKEVQTLVLNYRKK